MSIKYENDRMTGKDLDTYNKKKTYKNKMAPVQSRASDFRKQKHKWPRLGSKTMSMKFESDRVTRKDLDTYNKKGPRQTKWRLGGHARVISENKTPGDPD